MTDLTWRQQAEAAFRSALDGVRRVTGNMTAGHMTALGCALSVAEPLIRASERERIAKLADDRAAEIMRGRKGCGAGAEELWRFAEVLRGGHD